MAAEEREKKLKELQLELIKLNAQVATGTPPRNAGQLKRLKKDLAKLMLLKGLDEKKALHQKTQQVKTQLKPQPKPTSAPKKDKKPSEKTTKKTK